MAKFVYKNNGWAEPVATTVKRRRIYKYLAILGWISTATLLGIMKAKGLF